MQHDQKNQNDVINRRNKRLLRFFKHYFKDSVIIYGDPNKPCIILNHKTVLSFFVHNFSVCFTDKFKNGEILFKIKLQDKQNYPPDEEFNHWLHHAKHYQCYVINVEGTHLHLSGYKTKNNVRYPIYSKHGFKYYFNFEDANQIAEQYSDSKTKLIVK